MAAKLARTGLKAVAGPSRYFDINALPGVTVGKLNGKDIAELQMKVSDNVSEPVQEQPIPVPSAFNELPNKTKMKRKAMNIHLGATLSIPGVENLSRVGTTSSTSLAPKDDPFQGLPFHDLAEYLGEQVMPALEHAKKDQIRQQREAKMAIQNAQVAVPHVPHILPFTRWASTDENFRSTLVVDDDKAQKARLSWYHPDDTMVPRDWFSKGAMMVFQQTVLDTPSIAAAIGM
ncbi:hypothetical protein M9434_003808 [Picochlorum sp. BPE23]|nr:hypothetical protein M9434_003808 [Picochlorum sp. BPE23]